MKITKKKTVLIVIIIAIIGIVIWMLSNPSKKNEIAFDTAIVTKRDISNSVTATGSIEPVTKVEVGTQVSGIIDKLYADYNSTVTKGQLIAEMDKVTLQSELDSKQAAYDGSKAEYEYQQKKYARSKTLYDKNLISDTEYEEAVYNYEKAKVLIKVKKQSWQKQNGILPMQPSHHLSTVS